MWRPASGRKCAARRRFRILRRSRALQVPIKPLQHEESLLLPAAFTHKSLAVEIILHVRERPSRTAKVFENPRSGSSQKRNALQHGNLMLVETLLIFLGPACKRIAVVAKERVSSEFTHNQRLVVLRAPINRLCVRRTMDVPANVFF